LKKAADTHEDDYVAQTEASGYHAAIQRASQKSDQLAKNPTKGFSTPFFLWLPSGQQRMLGCFLSKRNGSRENLRKGMVSLSADGCCKHQLGT
jgi:hypothetical protein